MQPDPPWQGTLLKSGGNYTLHAEDRGWTWVEVKDLYQTEEEANDVFRQECQKYIRALADKLKRCAKLAYPNEPAFAKAAIESLLAN